MPVLNLNDNANTKRDIALIGKSHKGMVPVVRYREGHEPEIGLLKALKDGESTSDEVVSLSPDKGNTPFFRVNTIAEGWTHKGPAKVSTDAYRTGWDHMFGKVKPDDSVN